MGESLPIGEGTHREVARASRANATLSGDHPSGLERNADASLQFFS